jgi:hypothetical protein
VRCSSNRPGERLVSGGFERPVDFSYDACWFECPDCGDRAVMSFAERANGESRTCRSGHDVSAQTEYPARFSSGIRTECLLYRLPRRTALLPHRQ